MPRLIDGDALKQQFRHPIDYSDVYVRRMIDAAPTIDPERHAAWVDYSELDEAGHVDCHCSHCLAGEKHHPNIKVPYCWHCGSRMDKEVSDG